MQQPTSDLDRAIRMADACLADAEGARRDDRLFLAQKANAILTKALLQEIAQLRREMKSNA